MRTPFLPASVPTVLVLMVVASGVGCAPVKPWERGKLASPAMTARLGEDGFAGEYRGKMLESKTGGTPPGEAPGGGCGCTQ
jgi:hypothetical protein